MPGYNKESGIIFDPVNSPKLPANGRYAVFVKDTGNLFIVDSLGTETEIGTGTGTANISAGEGLSLESNVISVTGDYASTSLVSSVSGDLETQILNIPDPHEIEVSQTAHGFTKGQPIRLDPNTGNYILSKADIAENAEVYGVISEIIDANTFKYRVSGYISGLTPDLSAGLVYYLDTETAGEITTTVPVSGINKPLVYATDISSGIILEMRGFVLTDEISGTGFLDLIDTPSAYNANQYLRVNSTGDGIVFSDFTSPLYVSKTGDTMSGDLTITSISGSSDGQIVTVSSDGTLQNSSTTLTSISGDISSLESQIQSNDSDISSLQSDLAAISVAGGANISVAESPADTWTVSLDDTITGDHTFSDDLTVSGNLYVNGTEFVTNTESVSAADNLIIINSGEAGPGVTAGEAGIEVDRGSSTNYKFIFQESDDTFRIGEIGSTQAVATREDSPTANRLAYWDDSTNSFKTDRSIEVDGGDNVTIGGDAAIDGSLDVATINSTLGSLDLTGVLTVNDAATFQDSTTFQQIATFESTVQMDSNSPIRVIAGNGIDYIPGIDTDVDIATVRVGGTPKLSWDESEDRFAFSKGLEVGGSLVPSVSGGYDLGSIGSPFRDLYLTNNSLYLGSDKISILNENIAINDVGIENILSFDSISAASNANAVGSVSTTATASPGTIPDHFVIDFDTSLIDGPGGASNSVMSCRGKIVYTLSGSIWSIKGHYALADAYSLRHDSGVIDTTVADNNSYQIVSFSFDGPLLEVSINANSIAGTISLTASGSGFGTNEGSIVSSFTALNLS